MKKNVYKSKPKKMSISARKESSQLVPYDKDFYRWTREQMKLLKNKEFVKLDIDNLLEEIESLGNSEKNAIESYLIVLFLHLLKMEHQPAMKCNSWENSIENAKFRIKRLVEKNPSLRKKVSEFLSDAYFSARLQASSETGLSKETFPEKCPWTLEQIFPEMTKKAKKAKN